MSNGNGDKSIVKVLDRAVDIIKLLGSGDNETSYGVTEISNKLGISKTAVHRILSTLIKHEIVTKETNGDKYHLGWELFRIGQNVPNSTTYYKSVRKCIGDLHNEVQETATLSIRDGCYSLILDSRKMGSGLLCEVPVGAKEPIHTTALGKSLLLDFKKEQLEKLLGSCELTSVTPNTITNVNDLYEDIQKSKCRLYTLSSGEYIEGVIGIAAPVRDRSSEIIASISISGPSQRINKRITEQLVEKLNHCAIKASRELGFTGECVFNL